MLQEVALKLMYVGRTPEIGVDSELWIIIRLDLDALRLPRRDGRGRFGGGTSGDASGLVSSGCRKLEGAIGYSSKSVSWR